MQKWARHSVENVRIFQSIEFYVKLATWVPTFVTMLISRNLSKNCASKFPHGVFSSWAKCGNCRNSLSLFFRKNFVKTMVLQKKSLNSWFDEIFFQWERISRFSTLWWGNEWKYNFSVKLRRNFSDQNRPNTFFFAKILQQQAIIITFFNKERTLFILFFAILSYRVAKTLFSRKNWNQIAKS